MVGSSLVPLRTCTTSLPDNSYAQLPFLVPPEATATCLAPPRQSWRRRPFVHVTVKLWLGSCIDKEESSYFGCKQCAHAHVAHTVTPLLERCEGPFLMQNSQSFGKTKNRRRNLVVCTSTNTMLDCCNDADEGVSSAESDWTEEAFSSLHRSRLESQWALQSVVNCSSRDGIANLESPTCTDSKESVNLDAYPQQLRSSVVRSGRDSARRRRLTGRSKGDALDRGSGIGSWKASSVTLPTTPPVKKTRGKVKHEPLKSFVYTFLKTTNGCGMLTKDQEKAFTKQMRVCQNLEKAKCELKKRLGFDPSYELWAESVSMSIEELLATVKEGEIARSKMVHSHLRLVVSVARAYENCGMDLSDLVLEGSRGLLRGLEKFDHRKGHKLCTYVHWWIRQGVTRAIAEHSRLVRVPVYLHALIFAIKKAKILLSLEGRRVTVENISSVLNIPSEKIRRALRVKSRVFSFDKSDSSYGLKMDYEGSHELVGDSTGENDPWHMCSEENILGMARDCLSLLSSREQEIIRWYFGMDTGAGTRAPMTSISKKLGVSTTRVRQIRDHALSKMRRLKENDGVTSLLVDVENLF